MIYEWSTAIHEEKKTRNDRSVNKNRLPQATSICCIIFFQSRGPTGGRFRGFRTGLVTTFWAGHVYQQLKKRNNNTFIVAPIKRSRLQLTTILGCFFYCFCLWGGCYTLIDVERTVGGPCYDQFCTKIGCLKCQVPHVLGVTNCNISPLKGA
jgi:hypothetical protein